MTSFDFGQEHLILNLIMTNIQKNILNDMKDIQTEAITDLIKTKTHCKTPAVPVQTEGPVETRES